MLKVTKNTFTKYQQILNLAGNNNNITVMLSSGVDSVSILHFINNNKDKFAHCLGVKACNLKLQAFHFNHKLRSQNEKMEECARNFCEEYNIRLVSGSSKTNLKSEASARSARFNCLEEKVCNSVVITAHHLDDCIESYLLNVLRGHEGYTPIPFFTKLKNNIVAHPFLFHTKEDFKRYAAKFNLNRFIVEDETNNLTKGSRRNLMRQQIIPLLKQNEIVLNKTIFKKLEQKLNILHGQKIN